MNCLCRRSFLVALIGGSLLTNARADVPGDYESHIKPVLKSRCYACHGGLKQEAGLRLDTGVAIRRGGESGPAINLQSINQSLLIERITASDESVRMPPEGDPLSVEEIAVVRRWIQEGAKSPADEKPEPNPLDHWAFRKPVRPQLPQVNDDNLQANPIDVFLLQAQRHHQLLPQPRASKPVLLRRVYLDLIGLPPTQAELHAFLADGSPEVYERVVDQLLSSPQHGERWARHWMDVWRYSDWYGRRHVPDVWNSASQIWRWRDWIVKSLNEDHGYDRMVREMLAADEICPEDDEACYATGYLVRNWYALNPNDWMRNTVEHTGKAFLGLTFNCAHCHDHKYDPISHDDYFGLRAFFEPIYVRQVRVPGEADPGPFQDYEYSTLRKIQRLGSVRIFDKNPEAPTWFYTGGDERNRMEDRGSIPPHVPEFLSDGISAIEPVELPVVAWYPGSRPAIQEQLLAESRAVVTQAESRLEEARKKSDEMAMDIRNELAQAEQKYEAARAAADESGAPGALVGRQSLLLDATQGRRIVQNRVRQLKSLPDGILCEFQILIQSDAHANFQFARDLEKGLTALYIGFNQGRIVSYQPGSFQEFEAGRYDFSAGQNRFHVTLKLQTVSDRALLSVRSLSDDQQLLKDVPVALNGWNPVNDTVMGLSFDARTGSRVVIDDVRFATPPTDESASATLLNFDFEPPAYSDRQDVIGIAGWEESAFGVAPAISFVSESACNQQLQQARQELETARRVLQMPTLQLQTAEARLDAAQAELASREARIAADLLRYRPETDEETRSQLIRAASTKERLASQKQAAAELLQRKLELAEIEKKPSSDKDREKQLATAREAISSAEKTMKTAKAALADESRAETYTPFSAMYPKTSTGRRRALAEWVTSKQNPLTARVAVNHIWMRHFHTPLVDTVFDFGNNGADPTHPQLLDWLAVELMESGWSMKHLHRLIVTSDAYQRVTSSRGAEDWITIDPENRLLWRMNTGRMEAEVIRDSLLYCAGNLDLTLGGQELENNQSLTTFRRSLYYSTYPEEGGKSPLGELFDGPDALECYRRTRTVVPQQALAMTNSELIHSVSQKMVSDWQAQPDPSVVSDDELFVKSMFERILSRTPTDQERDLCLNLLAMENQASSDTGETPAATIRKRESLVRALLNHNDFIAIR